MVKKAKGALRVRIERISENKIKVVINREDTRLWNVSLKKFTDNSPEAQELFWFALKQAEQDVNFSVGRAQLLVETLDAGGEGFVMIISKLTGGSDLATELARSGKRIKQTEFRLSKKAKQQPLLRIFRFKDFDELCCGVSEICELYLGGSRLYKYGGSFYLELRPIDSFGFFEIENILSEFAKKCDNPLMLQGVLTEHGTVMIGADAISVITKNFA